MFPYSGRRRHGARPSVRLAATAAIVSLVAAGCTSNAETATSREPEPVLVEEGVLTVCTSIPYAPFEFVQDGEPVGFDIDLAREVAKSLELRTKIVPAGFANIQSGRVLNDGKCDVAVAALTITGERARVLDFSSPYFDANQVMVAPNESGISSLDDLSGRRVAVQAGTTGEIYVSDNAPPDAEIVPLEDAGQVDAALDSGEVDAGIYDNTVVDDVIARYPELEEVEVFNTGEQYGMAVKKNSNVDLLRVINEVLADLQANDRYDAIYKRWIGGSAENQ